MARSTGQIVALVFGVIFALSGTGLTISGAMMQATGILVGFGQTELASGIVLLLMGIVLIVFGARDRAPRAKGRRRAAGREA